MKSIIKALAFTEWSAMALAVNLNQDPTDIASYLACAVCHLSRTDYMIQMLIKASAKLYPQIFWTTSRLWKSFEPDVHLQYRRFRRAVAACETATCSRQEMTGKPCSLILIQAVANC